MTPPISKDVQERISQNLSMQISKILNSPDLKELNNKQLEYLAKSVIIDNLKEQLKNEVKKANLKIDKLKERWLATFNSNITRINYKHNVEVFLSWLNGKSIIDFRAIDADDYLQFLKNSKLNAGTIRFRIAAASSFCNYLKRADVVQTNYFQKINGLPKVKEKQKHIPSEKEIQVIKKELYQELNATGRGSSGKKQSAVIMILALSFIVKHALRVAALETLTISKGNFIADSKGNVVRGKVDEECLHLIEQFGFNKSKPFRGIKAATIKKQFERVMKRLFQAHKIEHIYSPHDFRHYAACKFYKETLDIYATMNYLNHKNITTTQIYLKGLNIL